MTKFMKAIIILSTIMLSYFVILMVLEAIYLLHSYGFYQLIGSLFIGGYSTVAIAFILYILFHPANTHKPVTKQQVYVQYQDLDEVVLN